MQNVAMFLRSVPNWEIVEPLPDVGEFFLISKELQEIDILSVQIIMWITAEFLFHSLKCSCIPQVGV